MSLFIEHTRCPECGSRDNLAIYTDHEYCFGCGHLKFYTYRKHYNETKRIEAPPVSLPFDIEPMIPAIADTWLKKYDLTQKELFDNRVVWSEFRQLLCFPYFDDKGFLWGWQGRYFGQDPAHPKWTGKGNFKAIEKIYSPLTEPEKDSIIILEDIISTIKVSRQFPSMCLFGSFVDVNKILKYKDKEILLWLDKDKEKESRIYSLQLNKIGVKSNVIVTNKDPKDYNNNEIKGIVLNGKNN